MDAKPRPAVRLTLDTGVIDSYGPHLLQAVRDNLLNRDEALRLLLDELFSTIRVIS